MYLAPDNYLPPLVYGRHRRISEFVPQDSVVVKGGARPTMSTTVQSFEDVVLTATGHPPYPYQRRIAEEGLPELLSAPTGSGKTVAAVLPWLYRRRFHPDERVRAATPRWLVVVLPMRVLVEQTVDSVRAWLDGLGLAEPLPSDAGGSDRGGIPVHVLMGGEPRRSPWRLQPHLDRVFVGTLDMVLSRQLNRGYGESRFMWPVDFGLFNAGCQFVFDEVQLMGPGLATSRQLHGLRSVLGTADRCRSMWMSATVDPAQLRTVDADQVPEPLEISDADRSGGLRRRLEATRRVERVEVDEKRFAAEVADHLLERHRRGTLTLSIHNTVDRARAVFAAVRKRSPDADVVLLHSRFRPPERREQVARALTPIDPEGPGRILISTQVVEAGVDISASVLITEAAPWPSIVQRAGRCNRDGASEDAVLGWLAPPRAAPYPDQDVDASMATLASLDGVNVTSSQLMDQQVETTQHIVPVLRRRDLVELFDTSPDLTGNDVDVSRFIRDADDLDVSIAWRPLGDDRPDPSEPLPSRDERCPVPVGEVRKLIGKSTLWVFDHLGARWRDASRDDVRPGATLLADSSFGQYTVEGGWTPGSKEAVEPIIASPDTPEPGDGLTSPDDRAIGDDPASMATEWTPLADHLAEAARAARELVELLDPPDLTIGQRSAVELAAGLHDLGKAHPAFQAMLRSAAAPDDPAPEETLLAKSKGGRGHYDDAERRWFRHEFASALALEDASSRLLSGHAEPDLIRYLVAAHHGRVRLTARRHPNEAAHLVLGLERDGETLEIDGLLEEPIGPVRLDPSCMEIGAHDGRPSWTARVLRLRDRDDLGPFRLAYLEALVRVADWRVSAEPGVETVWRNHA